MDTRNFRPIVFYLWVDNRSIFSFLKSISVNEILRLRASNSKFGNWKWWKLDEKSFLHWKSKNHLYNFKKNKMKFWMSVWLQMILIFFEREELLISGFEPKPRHIGQSWAQTWFMGFACSKIHTIHHCCIKFLYFQHNNFSMHISMISYEGSSHWSVHWFWS